MASNAKFGKYVDVKSQQRTSISESAALHDFDQAYFEIHDDKFLNIIGDKATISLEVEKDYAFAHEAAVYLPDREEVFITSSRLDAEHGSTIKVGKLVREDTVWRYEEIPTEICMGNGGVNYQNGVLFCDQGNKTDQGGLVWMEATHPYTTKTLVSGYHHRLFNSLNDVVIHTDGSIWFTDPIYGYEQGFRQSPRLPCQVYRFEPLTGAIRAVADGFGRPNGLCFSPDQNTLYVTDTDWIHGDGTIDEMRVSSIYAFDVLLRHGGHHLSNRRLFAMADYGMPDGIKCDLDGNVYSGCGDGVNVWAPSGTLLGKIKIPGGIANFCFGRPGEVFLLNETRFWVAQLAPTTQGALLAKMGIRV